MDYGSVYWEARGVFVSDTEKEEEENAEKKDSLQEKKNIQSGWG